MPTVSVDKERFYEALGKKYTTEEFDELCFQFGIELDEDTTEEAKKTGERATLKIDIPANRYDLLCSEGISRALLVFLNKTSQPVIKLTQPAQMLEIHVTDSVNKIRPYICSAVLRGVKFTPDNYATFIDLQDKLHQNLGRRRTLMAMGTHDLDKIQGPFTFDARSPEDIKFAPLNRPGQELDGRQLMSVLEKDRNLRPYLSIIRDSPVYPVILDKNGVVCSVPPVINGEHSKITMDTKDIFIEMTGTDETRLESAINIFVSMFSQYSAEPFTVEPVKISYADGRSSIQPSLAPRKTTTRVSYVNSCTGLDLDAETIAKLLRRMGHAAAPSSSQPAEILDVEVPSTRPDILHECDLMEDTAVAYGFDNLPRRFPSTTTVGAPLPINKLTDLVRRECAYAGWTEVLPLILCSRDENYASLRVKDDNRAITLENPKTMEFQVVRTSLLPGILKTIRENRKHALPLRTFEVSDVAFRDEEADPQRCARNERHVSAIYFDKSANFEVVHGLLDHIMRALGIPHIQKDSKDKSKGYYLQSSQHPTFFPGRAATIHYRPEPRTSASQDGLATSGPSSASILERAATSKETQGSAAIDPPAQSTDLSSQAKDAISSTTDAMGKALADILGGGSESALLRKLQQGGGKGDIEIGHIGVLHPEVLAAFELNYPCSAMEFDLEVFL